MSGGPVGVAAVQLQDKLPPQGDILSIESGKWPEYGTALLCASGSREPAKAPPDLPHTMFTGGLLDVLRNGDPSAPIWLSLDDVQRLVRARLEAQFSDKAVLPEVHAPQQRMGRVDLVPLFRNPARHVVEAASPKPERATTAFERPSELRLSASASSVATAVAALGPPAAVKTLSPDQPVIRNSKRIVTPKHPRDSLR
jgi:hypothetical protein